MDVKGGIRGQKDQAGIGTQTSSAMERGAGACKRNRHGARRTPGHLSFGSAVTH